MYSTDLWQRENDEIKRQYLYTYSICRTNARDYTDSTKIKIIDSLTKMMEIIRRRVTELPEEIKKENKALIIELNRYYSDLTNEIEEDKIYTSGTVTTVRSGGRSKILLAMESIQHHVYSISGIIKILEERSESNLDILTEILFEISELEIEESDSVTTVIIEKLDEILSNKEKVSKITNIRTVLEQILLLLLIKEEIENKNSFHINLQQCRKNNLFTKKTIESLGKNYSHISQYLHGEIKLTSSEYKYTLNIAIESIKLILNKIKMKTKKESK